MKYTNIHLRKSYRFSKALFYMSFIVLLLGAFVLTFGFVRAKQQVNNIEPLEQVLKEYKNPANKTAFIEIIEVPLKVSEDEHEIYYLVTGKEDKYVAGMQKEQYEKLKSEVEKVGMARLEGFTKVIIDEKVKRDVDDYVDDNNIHIRVTNLTYFGALKEGYIVNLVLGGLISCVSLIFVLIGIKACKRYRNPLAKRIDEECNRNDSIWINEFQIYLTNSYIVATYNGIEAIEVETVKEIAASDVIDANGTTRVLEARTTDNKSVRLYETKCVFDDIYEEDVNSLKEIFGEKNIVFNCEIDLIEEDVEDEDE